MPEPTDPRSRLLANPWIALMLCLLAIAGTMAYELHSRRSAIDLQERQRLAHQTEMLERSLSRQLQLTANALEMMRAQVAPRLLQREEREAMSRELKTMAAGMPGLRVLKIVDAQGVVVASNRAQQIGQHLDATERLRIMQRGGDPGLVYIAPPYELPTGGYTVSLGQVVQDARGRTLGYVIAGLDPEHFGLMLRSALYAPDMRALLVHGGGRVVFRHPDPEQLSGSDLGAHPNSFTARHLASGRDSNMLSGVTASTGEHLLMAIRTVGPESSRSDAALLVMLGRENGAIYADWWQDLMLRALLLGAIALGAAGGLWLHQKRRLALERSLADEEAAREQAERKLRDQESRRSQVEEKLRDSEARFVQLFEDMRQAVLLLEDGRYIAANRAALAMLRLDQAEPLIGRAPADFSPPLQPDGRLSHEKAQEMMVIARELGSNVFEWAHLRANGEPFLTRVLLTVLHQGGKELMQIALQDIAEQRIGRKEIEFLAFNDALTGLPNRLLGHEQLERALKSAARDKERLAVLNIALHGLSEINAAYGELFGDHLLVSVAVRISECLGSEEKLCRRSGDGFMVVLPHLQSYQQVSDLSDGIRQRCAAAFGIEGVQLGVELSIGAAFYPKDGGDADSLLRSADAALREAKRAGAGSCFFFEPQMNARIERYAQTREALRLAIARDEFELHYLPRIELGSGRVVGAEAVLRWREADGLRALPDDFIAVAEESGLMVQLGRWALRTACRDAVAWQPLTVSVPLSIVQYRGGIAERDVQAALSDSGLDPRRLELVLPEAALREHDAAGLAMLSRWAESGIGLCVDDFGKGYANLGAIRRLRIGKVRVDLENCCTADERAVLQALLDGARSLDVRTAAKGIPDAAAAHALAAMGCDEGLGHLLPQAASARDFSRRLSDRMPA